MFLAMMLVNAKRTEACSVVLAVEGATPRIEMLLADGSRRPLVAPPAEVLLEIVALLEQGQRECSSSVYAVNIEEVTVQRGIDSAQAHISRWSVGHVPR